MSKIFLQKFFKISVLLYILAASNTAFALANPTILSERKYGKDLFLEDQYLPIVAVKLGFARTGFAYDPDNLPGLANYVVAMLGEGAGPYDAKSLQEKMESQAIVINGEATADEVVFTIQTTRPKISEALRLLALIITNPRLEKKTQERISAQINIEQKAAAKDPEFLALQTLKKRSWGAHPYTRDALGNMESRNKITPEIIKKFLQQNFTKNRLSSAVVGGISAAEWQAEWNVFLENIPAGQEPAPEITSPIWQAKGGIESISLPVSQAVVAFAIPAPKRIDEKFYTAFILNHILGGGDLNSRLMQALREERGLVYSAQTGIELYQQGVFCFGFAGTKTGKEHEVVEQIKQIWQTLKTEEISAADLAHAKNYLTGSLANKLTRNRDIAALIYPIARQQAPLEFLNIRNQMISKVDKISLRNYIKSLPNLEDLPIVIVGSKTIDFRPSQTMK